MDWKPNKAELIEITLVNYGTVRALATIQVNGFLIKDIKVIHQKGQKPYVRLPEAAFIGSDGKKHYKHILEVKDPDLKRDLNKVVLVAYYKELIKKEKEEKTTQLRNLTRRSKQ